MKESLQHDNFYARRRVWVFMMRTKCIHRFMVSLSSVRGVYALTRRGPIYVYKIRQNEDEMLMAKHEEKLVT